MHNRDHASVADTSSASYNALIICLTCGPHFQKIDTPVQNKEISLSVKGRYF